MSSTRRAARAVARAPELRQRHGHARRVPRYSAAGPYAAASLPRNSVGTKQLKRDAVTRSKLADRSVGTSQLGRLSVTTNRLSRGVQRSLRRIGARGPSGPQGLTGARGATGPAGPGARRVDYSAAAAATATPATVAGPRRRAASRRRACRTGANVAMPISVSTAGRRRLSRPSRRDGGQRPQQPRTDGNRATTRPRWPPVRPRTSVGPPRTCLRARPGTSTGRSPRPSSSARAQTVTLTVAAIADATTGRCTFRGSAVPSS